MSTHDLKIWPEHFRDLVEGRKTMTLRRDDRGFKEGDHLLLREWDRFSRAYTGQEATRTVSLVTRGCTVAGLEPGYAILSLVEPDRARWGAFITQRAEALGVKPVFEEVEEEALLREVARLKARAGEDDRAQAAPGRAGSHRCADLRPSQPHCLACPWVWVYPR